MSGWAGALRAARRTAVRSKGRTALVLTLIALPVAVVVAGDVLARTGDISVRESLPQTIGAADARIDAVAGGEAVEQDANADVRVCVCDGTAAPRAVADVLRQLPSGSRVLPVGRGDAPIAYNGGLVRATTQEVDLADPVTRGLFDLEQGRVPRTAHEVVVSQRLVDRGFAVGSRLPLPGKQLTVVGVIGFAPHLYGADAALVVGPPASLGLPSVTQWLAVVPGGVSWAQVRELNANGLFVLSRKVVTDPPAKSELPASVASSGSSGRDTLLLLVVVLALLQVVLLAAPAFAVGARRQRRVLAMIGATGGAPKHVRRFVLAQGVVLGGFAGVLGAATGVVAGVLLRPTLSWADTPPGPLEVSWRDTVLTAAVGLVAATLAALFPALVAGRQDVLAGLTGRRGTTGRSWRTFVAGVVVLGLGILGCVSAAQPTAGQFTIVFAALPTVLGAALLAPSAIALAARRVGRLPFSLRFALRDAARSRGRTAAAAAAVTATVAGAVALGIGGASDTLQGERTYRAAAPLGTAIVSGIAEGGSSRLAAVHASVSRRLPGRSTVDIAGVPFGTVEVVGSVEGASVLTSFGGVVDAGVLVGPTGLQLLGLSRAELAAAEAGLRRTGAVVLADDVAAARSVRLERHEEAGDTATGSVTLSPYVVANRNRTAPVAAVLRPDVMARLHAPVNTVGMLIRGGVSASEEDLLDEELSALGGGYVTVERGYRGSSSQRLAMLVLGGTAAVLVLGGTLSAALLALSDARPDFATLMAVGAPPRVRRRVAAAYAAVIGLLGSVLGTVAGFAPGVAVSDPLTRNSGPEFASHYLDVPWALVLGLCVVVPLVAAAGAALLTRSRLPLAGRVEA